MSCNGICTRYKVSKSNGVRRYEAGLKRCTICNIYIKCNELSCPCCNMKLRLSTRYTKLKEKYTQIRRI